MSRDKKRHHYVPVWLSSRFCIHEKELFLYDTLLNKVYSSSPKDSFASRQLHSLVLDDGGMDHNSVEDFLGVIEGLGAEAVRKYIAGDFSENVRFSLAQFWALQYLRTPVRRRETEVFLKEFVKCTVINLESKKLLPEIPNELKEYGDNLAELFKNNAVEAEILAQATMLPMTKIEETANFLFNMNWCLINFDNINKYLCISDNPCSMFDPFYGKAISILGFMNDNIEVTLPLDMHNCIVASWKDIPLKINGTFEILRELNKRTAIFSERFIAYPEKSEQMLKFFKKFSEGHPELEVEIVKVEQKGSMVVGKSNYLKSPKIRKHFMKCRSVFS